VTLPAALLLDLDDTILAFTLSAQPCWREAIGRFTVSLSGVTDDEVFGAVRSAADLFWSDPKRDDRGRLDLAWARRQIVGDALEALSVGDEGVAHAIADRYHDLRAERVTLFPGALSTLYELRARGIRLGLVTNGSSDGQRAKIDRFDLEHRFDVICIEGEQGAGKPDPRIFQAALSALDAEPQQAWMVGDNLQRDVAGAQALGILGIWYDWQGRGLPDDTGVRPDRIVNSLPELVAY